MELYRFRRNIDIPHFIATFNRVRRTLALQNRAISASVEPNFIYMSLQTTHTCIIQGQPNSFGNGPYGDGVNSSGNLSDFNQQWAFQFLAHKSPAITSPDPINTNVTTSTHPVDVVIFDTSPFNGITETNPIKSGIIGNGVTQTVELSSTQKMTLQVWHWKLNDEVASTKGITDSDEHGVFIASLIHKIVPASTIKLVRVLDNGGCSDGNTLVNAMGNFIQSEKAQISQGKRVVFNLSLGVPASVLTDVVDLAPLEGTLFHTMNENGILVVAAAGNDLGKPLLLPAGFSDDSQLNPFTKVIAVEAHNSKGEPACFSNKGQNALLAPGGEGKSEKDKDGNINPCASDLNDCTDKTTCDQAIMGRTHDGRWIFWAGTSFAAPLVSGAAAHWLSQGCTPQQVYDQLTQKSQSIIDLRASPCSP